MRAAVLLGLTAFALCVGSSLTAQAQYRRQGGFFDQLFGGFQAQPRFGVEHPQPQADSSRAPAPHKPETSPTTSIVVMGDSMADWLAYGLEDAFADTPDVGVVRKHRTFSGLIRYEARSDLDWPHVAHDILAQEKADYVVMMIGLADRIPFREAPLRNAAKGKEPPKDPSKTTNKDAADTVAPPGDAQQQASIVAPEPRRAPGGVAEFRSDRWAELYTKRLDDTIAALKSKGVPVFWVGLPAVRGTRSTADIVYLNDLYRARAEKAGIVYVDVWDGFVDEAGRYSQMGPDLEGQTRRLRTADGVHFTKFGARKLAHYVEREIRRVMQGHTLPIALPGPGVTPAPDARPGTTVRPLAGPIVPLNVVPTGSDELAGGGAPRQANADPLASRVLVKGEPTIAAPGRADDFAWPRGSARVAAPTPLPQSPASASASPAQTPIGAQGASAPQAATVAAPQGLAQAKKKTATAKQPWQAGAVWRPQGPIPPQAIGSAPPSRPARRPFDPLGWMR